MEKTNIIYNQWIPYTEYEKKECDIKLKNGKIVKHVYPNAGWFEGCCGNNRKRVDENIVAEIMYLKYYQEDLCKGDCNG